MGANKSHNIIHHLLTMLKGAGQNEKDHEVPVLRVDMHLHLTLGRSQTLR